MLLTSLGNIRGFYVQKNQAQCLISVLPGEGSGFGRTTFGNMNFYHL